MPIELRKNNNQNCEHKSIATRFFITILILVLVYIAELCEWHIVIDYRTDIVYIIQHRVDTLKCEFGDSM